jgi:predicted GNAT family acetyltransferase
MLDQGRSFCTLFTDLANPTANHVYQRIGYRPIGDFTVYRFDG